MSERPKVIGLFSRRELSPSELEVGLDAQRGIVYGDAAGDLETLLEYDFDPPTDPTEYHALMHGEHHVRDKEGKSMLLRYQLLVETLARMHKFGEDAVNFLFCQLKSGDPERRMRVAYALTELSCGIREQEYPQYEGDDPLLRNLGSIKMQTIQCEPLECRSVFGESILEALPVAVPEAVGRYIRQRLAPGRPD